MPGLARPVRILVRVLLNAAMLWSILACAFCLISAIVAMLCSSSCAVSGVDQRALVLAEHHALERSVLDDREHADRQLLVAAQRERRRVHDAEVARHRLVETD